MCKRGLFEFLRQCDNVPVVIPPMDEVLAYDGDATHAALTLELAADTETPISLYYKLSQDRPNAFLLESVEGGETIGRYSFIGFDIETLIDCEAGKDPLAAVQTALAAYDVIARPDIPRFQGGAVGYLGYDCVRHFEPVPLPENSVLGIDDARFMLVEDLAIFDHLKQRVILLTHMPLAGDRRWAYRACAKRLSALVGRLTDPPPSPRELVPDSALKLPQARSNLSKDQYERAVLAAKEAIVAGEIFQVVLSQRFTVDAHVDPFELYRALRALNPSPYMFYLRFENASIVGASPEVLVRKEGNEVLVRPIAGTRRRGADRKEDEALEKDLLADEKELAEHRMLLDLGRNDVGRIAKLGSVEVDRPLHIERYSHVMHIVSDVRGQIRDGQSAYDVLRACFPAGTLSGAPKIRAMELISQYEPDRRGLYGGAVGYFDFTGNMDTCIAIRTVLVEKDAVHVQAGAGIVHDSVPESEYQECVSKAKSCMTAIAHALGSST
jgi:anthranilate synthase component I